VSRTLAQARVATGEAGVVDREAARALFWTTGDFLAMPSSGTVGENQARDLLDQCRTLLRQAVYS
jgi:hypothetical protein